MLDFTSTLYLGFRHASRELRTWAQLTMGVPAALAEPAYARATASRLASLTGTEAGVFARSTLHAFWDLVLLLAGPRTVVLVDEGTYPVARWGVERVAARGIPVRAFAHHQTDELRSMAKRAARDGHSALIVTDGVCSSCGQTAPVRDYIEIAAGTGGRLLIDDTQGLGLLGPHGGGSLRQAGTTQPAVLVASLAKAFGAPLAFVGGSMDDVTMYMRHSETRVHLSPPSLAEYHAAENAVDLNARVGDARRRRLRALIARFRRGLAAIGLAWPATVERALLPVQPVPPIAGLSAARVYEHLLNSGIRGVLHRGCDGLPRVSLVVSATHAGWQIDCALRVLATAC